MLDMVMGRCHGLMDHDDDAVLQKSTSSALCGSLPLAFCIKFRSMSRSLANLMRFGCFVAFVLVVRLRAKPVVSCAIGWLQNLVGR